MTHEQRHRTALAALRKQILDAVAFFQQAISRVTRLAGKELRDLISEARHFEAQFEHHAQVGWPASLSALAEETDYLAQRFHRLASERLQGSDGTTLPSS